MKKFGLITTLLVGMLTLWMNSCSNDNGTGNNVDVSGTWRSTVTFQTCSPADVCAAAGFTAGRMQSAVMTLTQNGNKLQGTYTYQGAPVSADITGNVNGNQVTLDGTASNILGSVTVHLTGTVNNNVMDSNVSHNVSLIDGRSGAVTATGQFTRS